MKLAALYLDDIVVIPGGAEVGHGQARVDCRDTSFHSEAGWSIEMPSPGVFTLHRPGMAQPVYVGGYGYAYTELVEVIPFVEESKSATVNKPRVKR